MSIPESKKPAVAGRPVPAKGGASTHRPGLSGRSGGRPAPELPPRNPNAPQQLRGMKDILPADQPWWEAVRRQADLEAAAFGFGRIETPVVEATALFQRSIGEATDIVEKEMYTFTDKGGDSVTLRPEFTAGIVRAYLDHGLVAWPQPAKLYTLGPLFRYDRPQAGRFRQFWQLNFEVIGDAHPVVDAELLLLVYHFFTALRITPSLQVNSIGDGQCRPAYVKALTDYLKPRRAQLCEACQRRLQNNPLRVLDCQQPICRAITQDAPPTMDHLCEDCRQHFTRVLEYLDEVDVPYALNPRLVRGFDYYTRTTFEVWPSDDEAGGQSALGGGGRYDGLAEVLGGRPTPAAGFALGVERIVHLLKERQAPVPQPEPPEVFVAQLGDAARKRALKLFRDLREAGVRATAVFSKEGIKPQLEAANRLKVPYALIIGQKELLDGTVMFRDMESGIQEVVDVAKIVTEVKKRLKRVNGAAAPTTGAEIRQP